MSDLRYFNGHRLERKEHELLEEQMRNDGGKLTSDRKQQGIKEIREINNEVAQMFKEGYDVDES